MVGNLLCNALKFTPSGGEVRVRVAECGRADGGRETGDGRAAAQSAGPSPVSGPPSPVRDAACIVVEDTGVGMGQDQLAHRFELFTQGEMAAPRRPGLGLGLALVKGIVERHGGRVWAESEGPGKGSRFTVELPLIPPPAAGPARPRRHRHAAPMRVLLVEDTPDTRTAIGEGLVLGGYDVRTAGTGEEALEVLHEYRPDVMLVDIGLPGMDGVEFLREARRLRWVADVPAFAVTGYGAEEDVRRGREAGFAGHFVKPIDLRALEERIGELLAAPSAP